MVYSNLGVLLVQGTTPSNVITTEITASALKQFVQTFYCGLSVPHDDDIIGLDMTITDTSNESVSISGSNTYVGTNLFNAIDGEVNKVTFSITFNTIPTSEQLAAISAKSHYVLSEYLFTIQSLGLWITPQQQMQFMAMYPDCFTDAYRTAIGKLQAQIGNIFDVEAMLAETDEEKKDKTIRWILQVQTAYFVCSPSMDISDPLEKAMKEITNLIGQLKSGQSSLQEPTPKREEEYYAGGEIITFKNKYIG